MLTYTITVHTTHGATVVEMLLRGVRMPLALLAGRGQDCMSFEWSEWGIKGKKYRFATDSTELAQRITLELANYSISVTEQS